MFKKNVGPVDSAIRLTLGIVALAAGFFALGALQGNVFGLFAVAIGVIGVVTGATRRCPTYVLLGISTDGSETPAVAQHTSRARA
jgi:hypothetical protein